MNLWAKCLVAAILFAVGGHSLAPVAAAQSGVVEDALREVQAVFGVSPARLRCIIYKESRGKWDAYNAAGPYYGIVQFGTPLWQRGLRIARNPADPSFPLVPPGSSPNQPREALLMAGYFISHGEPGHWPTDAGCPGR